MTEKRIISFGNYGQITVIFETSEDGLETKVKLEPQNKDGTFLVIGSKDKTNFLYDFAQTVLRYFI